MFSKNTVQVIFRLRIPYLCLKNLQGSLSLRRSLTLESYYPESLDVSVFGRQMESLQSLQIQNAIEGFLLLLSIAPL